MSMSGTASNVLTWWNIVQFIYERALTEGCYQIAGRAVWLFYKDMKEATRIKQNVYFLDFVVLELTYFGWCFKVVPFLTDYDHQGPLPGVDRFLYNAGNLENQIPWIFLYLAGSMTPMFGWNRQETLLRPSLECDLDLTEAKLTYCSLTIRPRVSIECTTQVQSKTHSRPIWGKCKEG